MNKYLQLLLCLLLLSGCYKDEIDVDGLNNNPFDRDYTGGSLFHDFTAYIDPAPPPGQPARQIIEFKVREELMLHDVTYSVQVVEQGQEGVFLLDPVPPNSNIFKYYRLEDPEYELICLELRLANNGSTANAELHCVDP